MRSRWPLARFAGAALCAALGVGMLAARSGADEGHSSVFQSFGEAAAVGTFYTRPGQLPTGKDVVALDLGYARTNVSILSTDGLGAYLWLGDLAAGYKETVALGAEQAPPSFRQAILSAPDYPFMARARYPGSQADRSRETSLNTSFDSRDGLRIDTARARGTADPDGASGSSVVGGVALTTSSGVFLDALASFRQQLSVITGRSPVPAERGTILAFAGGRTSTTSSFSGPTLVVSTQASMWGTTALEGLIRIDKLGATATATSDGSKGTASPKTTLSKILVGGYQATVGADGIRVLDASLSSGQLRAVNDALAGTLATAGVTITPASDQSTPASGGDVSVARAGVLDVKLDIDKVFSPRRSQLPAALQQAVTGDSVRLTLGAAVAGAAVAPDAPFTVGSSGGGAEGPPSVGAGSVSVLGEQLAAPVPPGPGTASAPQVAAAPPSVPGSSARPAGAVSYLGVPGWAMLLGAALLLAGATALSFLGVWQML